MNFLSDLQIYSVSVDRCCTIFLKRKVLSDICSTVVTEKRGRKVDGDHYYRAVNKTDGK
jgi:hypothetical protein